MKAKIYKIINTVNSKIYVGQTYKTIEERFNRHCAEARWKNKKKMPIISAIFKYGADKFSICLLEELHSDYTQIQVDEKEKEWGYKLNTLAPNGYNLRLGNGIGALSQETRDKISKSNIGRIVSEETKLKSSISHRGYVKSPQTLAKMSAHFKGKPTHPNTRLGASLKCAKTYSFVSPDGVNIQITNLKKYCKENKLHYPRMNGVANGKLKAYRGWAKVSLIPLLFS